MTTSESRDEAVGSGDVDFDHHSLTFRDHPHEALAELRSRGPVLHSSAHDGFWVLTDYASVFEAAKDDARFSSAESVGIPASGMPFPILPIESDPPQTQQLRAITMTPFSPGTVKSLQPDMREIATELIDAFIERGECDLVQELTTPLPARLMLRMLGFDESTWRSWVERVHLVIHDRAHDLDAAMTAAGSLLTELGTEMERRREAAPTSDLYARIVHGSVDGVPLDDVQITMYGFLMMLGGMDTTSGLTSNSLLQLCVQPNLRQRLIDDRSLLPAATEEFLRHDTPTLGLARTVTEDATMAGQSLKAGERALLMWAGANRDPAVFENPDEIDFDRENKRHLAFGVGKHRCLGSNLAREMFKVMIDEILTRLPDFRLAGEPVRFSDAGEVHALRHLPVIFTPGPRRK
ncbi:cytochrome P450 [Cryptosporangium aurantiacum]|uniref:Cytochrome P450 n=1 Tax=Cryptosporangium aurantiacum TaxID=134849 RepID=A0A1M7PFW2_9ACTN|nr:Cytochrome P450 [Cryptosporangium aurantiacum]